MALTTSAPISALRSTVGQKAIMAASGLVMLLYLLAHMIGNLKAFGGQADFNHYASWLRTMGEPAVPRRVGLTLVEIVLTVSVIAHATCAIQLWRRARRARPVGYATPHRDYATRTIRWGGVIIALFLVYHLLDLTFRVVNPLGAADNPYGNLVASFREWPVVLFYALAVCAVGVHVRHGITSGLASLGSSRPGITLAADIVAVILVGGFLSVPLGVVFGAIR